MGSLFVSFANDAFDFQWIHECTKQQLPNIESTVINIFGSLLYNQHFHGKSCRRK